jgi:hypothetical protein
MATITYRGLDPNGEPLYGNGQNNFVSDLYAVAQAIGTRLKLFQGEWWENVNAGTPLFQAMLGVSGVGRNPDAIALLIKQRILGTPYVLPGGVSNVAASYNGATRSFSFSCSVATQFGTLTVANQPTPPTAALS